MGNSQGKPVEFDGEGTDHPADDTLCSLPTRSILRPGVCCVASHGIS